VVVSLSEFEAGLKWFAVRKACAHRKTEGTAG
jgi:hypothetical protein